MTQGEKVLVGCCITIVAVILLGISGCGLFFYRGAANFPEYAKMKNASNDHRDVIQKVEKIISSSVSFPEMQQKLTESAWPGKVLYFKLSEDEINLRANKEPQSAEILKRLEWNGYSSYVINGFGHGHLDSPNYGKVNIIIIHKQKESGYAVSMDYLIYIEAPDSKSR